MAEVVNIKPAPDEKGTPDTREIAHVTRDVNIQFFGYLGIKGGAVLVNPDKVIARESGGLEIDLYEDLEDKDAHITCEAGKRRLAVSQIEYQIVPGSAAPDAEKIADRVREYFAWIPKLSEAVLHLADATIKGYSVSEIMWDASEGDVWVRDIIGRRQRRFVFDADGNIRLRVPENMITGEIMPPRKFLHHVFAGHRKDNPYGRALGRVLYWPSWFKRNDIKFWVIFCEKFGMPTAKGTYPRGSQDHEIQKLLDAMDAIQSRSGIAIPEGMMIELLEGQRAGSINTYETLFKAMNEEISKAILGQTASAVGTPGKLGNEELQGEVRRDILTYDARSIAGTLQELADWITLYNFGDVGRGMWPLVKPKIEEPEDLNLKADRDKKLIEAGVPVGVDYFYDTYGIPRPQDGEAVAQRAPQFQVPPEFASRLTPHHSRLTDFAEPIRALARAQDKQADEIERFVQLVFREMATGFRAQLQKIKDAVASARDFADAQGVKIGEPDGAFVDLLSRAMATADLLGREHVLERAEASVDFAEIVPKPLAPLEAIEFFKKLKATIAPEDLDTVDRAYDARAFRVAGAANQRVLDGIKARIETALERGQTFAEFQDNIDAMFDRLGVTKLAPHHLETVFRTNVQQSYMAGRYEQLHRPGMDKTFPYFQYHTVGDDRVRPEHAAMNGFVARRDDPIWETWWPPNSYNCRCSVTPISTFEAEDLGLKLDDDKPAAWLTAEGKISAKSPSLGAFNPYTSTPDFPNNPGKDVFQRS